MRVTAQIRYPAPVDEVYAMLTDPDFQDAKLRATGSLSWEVSVSPEGDGHRVHTTRDLPTDRVPSAFKAAVGDRITLTQDDVWAGAEGGSRAGTMRAQIAGAPIELTGTLSLEPDGDGTLQRIDAELKARIPLVGGRVEKAAEPAVRAAIEAEERVGTDWLAAR